MLYNHESLGIFKRLLRLRMGIKIFKLEQKSCDDVYQAGVLLEKAIKSKSVAIVIVVKSKKVLLSQILAF